MRSKNRVRIFAAALTASAIVSAATVEWGATGTVTAVINGIPLDVYSTNDHLKPMMLFVALLDGESADAGANRVLDEFFSTGDLSGFTAHLVTPPSAGEFFKSEFIGDDPRLFVPEFNGTERFGIIFAGTYSGQNPVVIFNAHKYEMFGYAFFWAADAEFTLNAAESVSSNPDVIDISYEDDSYRILVPVPEEMTWTPVAPPRSVEVYFVPQTGEVIVTTQTVGSAYSLPAPPSRDDYTFGGWYTGDNGTGTAVKQSGLVPNSPPVFIYANWLEQTDGFRWIKILGYIGGEAAVTVPPVIIGLPVTEIGAGAFSPDVNPSAQIKTVTLPSGVTKLGEAAFRNSNLTELNIDGVIANIPAASFEGCAGLRSFNFDGVQTIGENAFRNSGLQRVRLDGIESIAGGAFSGTPVTHILFKSDAPALTGNLIEESKVVYYLPPHTAQWTSFSNVHANTRMIGSTINTDSIADTADGFSFAIDGNLAAGDDITVRVVIEAKDLLTDTAWYPLATNTLFETFIDSAAPGLPSRFYRTVVLDAY